MDELIRNVGAQARGMWANRWLGLITAWVVGAVGAALVIVMPDKYEASARVYVDTQSVLKPLMSGLAVQPNIEQQIVILSRTLISRPNIERLIRMADLELNLADKHDREQLIDKLMRTLELRGEGRDNLFTVAFRDSDAARAKRVVQALLTIFVESGLSDKRRDSASAQKFLDEQIATYAKKLEDAESRVKEFKMRNLSVGLEPGTRDYFTRMTELATQLDAARLLLREAEQSRDVLRRQLEGEEPVLVPDSPDALSRFTVPDLDGRIDAQKRALDSLLQRYTDQHPDVLGTKRILADLEEQKKKELAARKNLPAAAAGSSGNPVWQQMKLSLGEAEAQVASLRARVAEFEGRVGQLRSTARMMPEVESELTQLMRDHEVHKRNYDALVSRRESASLSGNMEASAGVADFRIIDPPAVAPRPVAPDRPLLSAVALAAALLSGLAASFLMAQVRPLVFDPRGLNAVSGLPVLGVVTRIGRPEDGRKKRRALIAFTSATLALMGAYSAFFALLFATTRNT